MRVWLIGAGRAGSSVLKQLWKNLDIDVIVSDPHADPQAVKDGLIDSVNFVERITPMNINQIAQQIRPDLILIATGSGRKGYGNVEGSAALADAINYETAASSDCPCLIISRSNIA